MSKQGLKSKETQVRRARHPSARIAKIIKYNKVVNSGIRTSKKVIIKVTARANRIFGISRGTARGIGKWRNQMRDFRRQS